MINGCYEIMMKSPLGLKNGKLTLMSDNHSLMGQLSILGHDNPFDHGTYSGSSFSISGRMVTAWEILDYQLYGWLDHDMLIASLYCNKGCMLIHGMKLEK